MLDKAALAALIPHAGSMCLLDSVDAWDDTAIRCISNTHRDAANPLRRKDILSAVHLVEYAAQAMAVHGALLSGDGPQAGMLGVLRDIRLYVQRIDDLTAPLVVSATRRLARTDGLIYDFDIALDDSPRLLLSEGRISVVLQTNR
jgi:predicted hotdog family 3-hydroxylacyl-ACP dehydratase